MDDKHTVYLVAVLDFDALNAIAEGRASARRQASAAGPANFTRAGET